MHGGLSDDFVRTNTRASDYNNIDKVLEHINALKGDIMWQNGSPIWLRPQFRNIRMYKPRKLLQIVGHTPVAGIIKSDNIISCDVFSTYRDRSPIGTRQFLLIDTETWEYRAI